MATLERWHPAFELSEQEVFLIGRLTRVRKLLGFLRRHRHELIDDAFQEQLEGMYRAGGGKDPIAPGLMAMATLVQGYLGVSDAEMVELTVVDLRVQMVLGCLGTTKPPFSQGALQNFRERFIAEDMDRRLLERTYKLARETGEFDAKKLPKTLRVAMDSSPLEGAGRVEDTVNLLAHAARKVAESAAALLGWPLERLCQEAKIPCLLAPSAKKALDADWNDPAAKSEALNRLCSEVDSLEAWVLHKLPEERAKPPLKTHLETLEQIRNQDLEPDPGGGGLRIREGVAPDRRVSIEDAQMRHGRKSKSRRFNGYKRHIAADLDTDLILACALTPANRPEEEAAPALNADIKRQGLGIAKLLIDRGYVNSSVVDEVLSQRGEVVCKPWRPTNKKLFSKTAFKVNIRDRTVACPAGQSQHFELGASIEFDPEFCDHCQRRAECTSAEPGQGRSLSIAENEALQQRLRKLQASASGREQLRERTGIEHRLAHITQRQGRRARYKGTRKNEFDLRRAASIQNLETLHRRIEPELRKAA